MKTKPLGCLHVQRTIAPTAFNHDEHPSRCAVRRSKEKSIGLSAVPTANFAGKIPLPAICGDEDPMNFS